MFIDINGLKINYLSLGEGEQDVLLLHGWGADITLFKHIADRLSPHFRVIAPDFPGFGESDEPKTVWDVNSYTDFVISFCEKMNIKRCHIIAHSFGGRITIKLMSRKNLTFAVEKIVLTGSAGIKPKRSLKSKFKIVCYKIGKKLLSLGLSKRLMPNALENLRKKNGSADYNAASPMMRSCLVKIVNEDLTELIPSISVPTLIVWGEKDDAVPLSDAKLMEKLIPDSGLIVFEGCGHYAFLEQKERFFRIIESFFNIQSL